MNEKLQIIQLLGALFLLITLIGCDREAKTNDFPNAPFDKIIAYKMTGENGEVIENGKISNKVTGKGKLLNEQQVEELLNILQTKSTYGGVMAACFEPHIGYVFYTKEDNIVGHTTICLSCNSMRITPEIENFIFSDKGSTRLGELEDKIFSE